VLLPLAVILSGLRTLLIAAVGAAPLPEPRLTAALQAAIALAAIAVGTEEKDRAAFTAQANP
jgi:hypothetical protein